MLTTGVACAHALTLQSQAPANNFVEGLSVALDHPHLSTHPQVLCAAAYICKDWRQAVQQCNACNTVVQLFATAELPRLWSFAQWLSRHSRLLHSLSLRRQRSLLQGGVFQEYDKVDIAQLLLQRSLQAAARPPASAADAMPAAAPAALAAAAAYDAVPGTSTVICHQQVLLGRSSVTEAAVLQPVSAATAVPVAYQAGSNQVTSQAQQQQQQQQGLRLRSFSSNLDNVVDILAVLPPHSLAHLHLSLENATTDSSSLSAALVRLSRLQRLHLSRLPASFCMALTALTQLNQLTHLEVREWQEQIVGSDQQHSQQQVQPAAAALQQLLAQPLPLKELNLCPRLQLPALDMARLTKLTKLDASYCMILPVDSVLPAQLQHALEG
jgi:hypothetical protein